MQGTQLCPRLQVSRWQSRESKAEALTPNGQELAPLDVAVGCWVPIRRFTVKACVLVVRMHPFLIVCSWAI